eukprot:2189434-Rhodomonas_salina.1
MRHVTWKRVCGQVLVRYHVQFDPRIRAQTFRKFYSVRDFAKAIGATAGYMVLGLIVLNDVCIRGREREKRFGLRWSAETRERGWDRARPTPHARAARGRVGTRKREREEQRVGKCKSEWERVGTSVCV